MRVFLFAILSIFFLLPVVTYGQFSYNTISITGTPVNPTPNELVSMEVTSSSINLRQAGITWLENGEVVAQGIGLTNHEVSAGGQGVITIVSVVVQTLSGVVVDDSYIIVPADVVLSWEAQTYTPPFYKGKALYTNGSSVRIVALPQFFIEGTPLPSSELLYTWQERGRVLGTREAIGNNVITIDSTGTKQDLYITLEVSTPDGLITATKSITIPVHNPEVIVYRNHPLLGLLYNRAVTDSTGFNQEEVTLRAEPYFFPPQQLGYTWYLNNVPTDVRGPDILLTSAESESAIVTVSVEDIGGLLRTIQRTFSISFSSE